MNEPPKTNEDTDDFIVGRPKLAEFLTKNGFPIALRTLEKIPEEKAPPIFRRWGKKLVFRQNDALIWANRRFELCVSAPRIVPSAMASQEDDEVPPF